MNHSIRYTDKKNAAYQAAGGVFLIALLLISSFATTANGQGSALPDAANSRSYYHVSFSSLTYQGAVNAPLVIPIEMFPYPAPAGFFYSILADILAKPPGAQLKTHSGNRQLTIIGNKTGNYRLRIRVNILGKSSCGGIDAKEIKTGEMTIQLD